MEIKQIIEVIKAYDTIVIHRHIRPDPDAIGSQGGLKKMIQNSFPEKQVYAVGENDPSLSYLMEMDSIENHVYKNALVIVCDTANRPRIDDKRFDSGEKLVKIDHHLIVDSYGDLKWENPEASSVSEMIFELYLNGKSEGLKMSDESARLLYAGIVGDTGRFKFSNTTKKTFQYAAELVTYHFDRLALYDSMYEVSNNNSRLKGYILQHFSLLPSGLSTIRLSKEILKQYNVTAEETTKLIQVLSDVEGIKAWVFFIEEDQVIRVRFRSKGPAINEVAEKHGGGGHAMASGAEAKNWEETDQIIADLEEVCRAYAQNKV